MSNPSNEDLYLVQQAYYLAGYPLVRKEEAPYKYLLQLHYRNNPDGSVRWVWPAGAEEASCLRFYHMGNARAKWSAELMGRGFALKMEGMFSHGRMSLYTTQETFLAFRYGEARNHALFTGTPGPNRKAILWRRNKKGKGVFTKIALNEHTRQILSWERQVVSEIAALGLDRLRVPTILSEDRFTLSMEELEKDKEKTLSHFTLLHDRVLEELYLRTCRPQLQLQASWWKQVSDRIQALHNSGDMRIPKGMIRKLLYLHKEMAIGRVVPCCRAHGDFTPWNTAPLGDQLGVIDWELSLAEAPVMMDAFHFIVQSGLLIHRLPAALLWKQCMDLEDSALSNRIRMTYPLDLFFHFKLYLLITISFYLDLYSRQNVWHDQVNWLLEGWNQLLNSALIESQLLSARQLLCMDVFDFLQTKPYAAVKWVNTLPESLPVSSDIDLFVKSGEIAGLDRFFAFHPFVRSVRGRKRAHMKSYMALLEDGSCLALDAILSLKRKNWQVLSGDEALQGWFWDSGAVKVVSLPFNFAYVWLFYVLNNADVPEKFVDYFHSLVEEQKSSIAAYLCHCGSEEATSRLFPSGPSSKAAIYSVLKRQKANRGLRRWQGLFNYLVDTGIDFFRSAGLVISFSGVDGAGKSTVIEQTRYFLEKRLRRRVVVLRHRPSILPILSAYKYGRNEAQALAARTLPRRGTNGGKLSSLARFAYYYLDYLVGQFYVYFRYVRRGYIVLYDRFYFDCIHDCRRSNIDLPPRFTTWLYRFLLKPSLNFFLYASSEEILSRKQELDAETIRELTGKYLQLFDDLSGKGGNCRYIPLANRQLSKTVDTVINHIQNALS